MPTTYPSLQRTDVDVKAKPDAAGIKPNFQYARSSSTCSNWLAAPALTDASGQIRSSVEPAKLEAAINAGVAEMFAKYPTRYK